MTNAGIDMDRMTRQLWRPPRMSCAVFTMKSVMVFSFWSVALRKRDGAHAEVVLRPEVERKRAAVDFVVLGARGDELDRAARREAVRVAVVAELRPRVADEPVRDRVDVAGQALHLRRRVVTLLDQTDQVNLD